MAAKDKIIGRKEHVGSRKIRASIERCLAELSEGQFGERTVKELLIDLRELGRKVAGERATAPGRAVADFVEVCDFVAHGNRDRGHTARFIRDQAESLADAIARGQHEPLSEWGVVDPVGGEQVVGAMLGVAWMYLRGFDPTPSQDTVNPLLEWQHEIALCMISLLQDSFIELESKKGIASLHVVSHEGFYRLYCRLYGSKINAEAQARMGGSGQVIVEFPVIITGAPDIDGVLPPTTSEWHELPAAPPDPPIIEAYRANDGRLHVRIIETA